MLTAGGYLADPDGKYGSSRNPSLTSIRSLRDTPCLVLLGEPGIGKSTAVRDDFKELEASISPTEACALRYDLTSFGSEDRILRTIFEGELVRAWKGGSSLLYLYLDSLDECAVKVTNIASLIVEQLRDVPLDRLRLRVACRTAEWPSLLETKLPAYFGEAHVSVLELAPLRYVDVELAARNAGVATDSFLEQVHLAGAVPFASKPITLDFLLKIYTHNGTLPSTQVELYDKGCRVLCEERNEARLAEGRRGELTPGERMDAASWVAAVMTFCGKSVIRTEATNEPRTAEEIDLADLALPDKKASERAIRDVLSVSGLFSARGHSRLGWAHKTYAEFLAARFLMHQKLPVEQVLDLVLHHQDRNAVIPQLREAASWIASMRQDTFREIARRDPQVLLASDVTKADGNGREGLVRHLLERFDREEALDDNWDERGYCRKLAHPALAAQLRPYIITRSKNVVVRRVAIDIAEACELHELEPILLERVHNLSEEPQIRQQAAHALALIGNDSVKLHLKLLLASDKVSDPQDQLRGLALDALYPGLLSPAQMFATLAPPRDDNFYGAYTSFLYTRAATLTAEELPHALDWAVRMPIEERHSGPVNALQEAILKAAWQRGSAPAIRSGLVALVQRRLNEHQSPFGKPDDENEWIPGEAERHVVVRVLLAETEPEKATSLLYSSRAIIDQSDLAWLLDELEQEPGSESASTHVKLIGVLAWHENDPNVLNRLIGVAEMHEGLRVELADMLEPVFLGSPVAERMKRQHQTLMERPKPSPKRQPVGSGLDERVDAILTRCESEDIEYWWQATRDLSLAPEDTHYRSNFASQITKFPGWITATPARRARVVALAKRYIVEGDPANDAWFRTNEYRHSALSGYRALALLDEVDPEWLAALDPSILEKWIPIIVAYPHERRDSLTALAAARCEASVIARVIERLDAEEKTERAAANEVLNACWSAPVANAMLRKVEVTTSPAIANALIEQGIERGDERFVEAGERILSVPLPAHASEEVQNRRTDLWEILISRATRASWQTVVGAMRTHPTQFRKVWVQVASRCHRDVGDLLQPLTPHNVADLFIWLTRQFPSRKRKQQNGWIGPDQSLEDFRDAVLKHLQNLGDEGGIAAIDRVVEALSDVPFIKMHRVLARRAVAQGTWRPVRPEDLVKLVRDAPRRVIESEEQLQALVLASLQRFQSKLHAEHPAVVDLWNEIAKDDWRPVDEPDLSDRITRHLVDDLQERGIIVNREVKIRRGRPGFEGQQTDIYVDAMSSTTTESDVQERITVVVEVKGCWNSGVQTAMKTQLADRYLCDGACTHGLYVVGWFIDDGWGDADERKAVAKRLFGGTVDDARAEFEQQSRELSRDGKVIASFVLDAHLASK